MCIFVLLSESVSIKIPADAAWVKMNVRQTGFYRVHYDQANWQALSKQLQDKHQVRACSSTVWPGLDFNSESTPFLGALLPKKAVEPNKVYDSA